MSPFDDAFISAIRFIKFSRGCTICREGGEIPGPQAPSVRFAGGLSEQDAFSTLDSPKSSSSIIAKLGPKLGVREADEASGSPNSQDIQVERGAAIAGSQIA